MAHTIVIFSELWWLFSHVDGYDMSIFRVEQVGYENSRVWEKKRLSMRGVVQTILPVVATCGLPDLAYCAQEVSG